MSEGTETTLTAREAMQVKRLTTVLVVVGIFFFAEFAGGVIAGSHVLRTDALHLLMDCVALAASLIAMRLAVRKPTATFTFGLRRAEPVAALVNAGLVLIATVEIVHDAFESMGAGAIPNAKIMLPVSAVALVVNGFCAWLLHGAMGHSHGGHGHEHRHHGHGHDHHGADHEHDHRVADHGHGDHGHDHDKCAQGSSVGHGGAGSGGEKEEVSAGHGHVENAHAHGHELNLRGVWLHLMGDALGSLTALGAAIVIWFKGPRQADLIASLVVATIIAIGALRLIRDALVVLLEAAPKHLPADKVRAVLQAQPGVEAIVSLHIWTLGGGHDVVMAHVLASDGHVGPAAAAKIKSVLKVQYVTIQVDNARPS